MPADVNGAALGLLEAGVGIGEIARRCGFADHSAFSRTFRGVTGASPREWREDVAHDPLHESASPVHAQPKTPEAGET